MSKRAAVGVTLVIGCLSLLCLAGGFKLARHLDSGMVPNTVLLAWEESLARQRAQLERVKVISERELEALTVRMAQLQASLMRLDALGERITKVARFDSSEFNFGKAPALGGPVNEDANEPYSVPAFIGELDQLSIRLDDREQQLEILGTLLINRQLLDEVAVAGRPVTKGWVSSGFGQRTDPFKGNRAWHNGIDFAGQSGSEVVAVASGVVTWSDERQGYGLLVEISHGGGFVTRYAHNQGNLVAVGDVVKKGQVIATMGSSGRSTGPHVHFEVLKHGKSVDPASYINRPRRT